ncbi:sporulation-delaying protein SdpB family protein [Nocardia suismassiliense]|uniref:Sporulation-delaying protein SdpB family protein n=1 Tax=Nocardia suismassiliense TaxID=2077092 RepID=A0ABW6QN40_9NOCA
MCKLRRLIDHAMIATAHFEPRGLSLAAGRSLLAIAELSLILLTPDSALFPDVPGPSTAMRCDGVQAVSLWCITGSGEGALAWSRLAALGVLCLAASGFMPKWTCIPHWYVAFSINASIVPTNGGDAVAQVATMLLIPICLGDDRIWHWQPPKHSLSPGWQGSAFAAQLVICLQVFVIYAVAVVSKLSDPAWLGGHALYIVASDPLFAPPPPIRQLLEPAMTSFWAVAAMTWAVIVVQAAIAVSIFSNRRARLCGLILGSALHVMIIIVLGLPSFGLVMIALLLIVYRGLGPPGPTTEHASIVRGGRAVRVGDRLY